MARELANAVPMFYLMKEQQGQSSVGGQPKNRVEIAPLLDHTIHGLPCRSKAMLVQDAAGPNFWKDKEIARPPGQLGMTLSGFNYKLARCDCLSASWALNQLEVATIGVPCQKNWKKKKKMEWNRREEK